MKKEQTNMKKKMTRIDDLITQLKTLKKTLGNVPVLLDVQSVDSTIDDETAFVDVSVDIGKTYLNVDTNRLTRAVIIKSLHDMTSFHNETT